MRVVAFAVTAALLFSNVAADAQESQVVTLRAASRTSGDAASALVLARALRRAGHYGDALAELHRAVGATSPKSDLQRQLQWEVARVYMDRHDFHQAFATCG